MRIGVNTRFLLEKKMEGFGWYTYETMKRISQNHPEVEFIFFFDRPFGQQFIFSDNITPIVLYPPTRHPILQNIWFNFRIKNALKKHQCDAFISPDGYASLTTDVPQLIVMHDLNFEHNPEDLPKDIVRFLKNKFPRFAHKAKRICTVSEYSKEDICSTYNIPKDKIDVTLNGGSDIFKLLKGEEKENIRNKYTEGNPYIIFVGAIHKRKNLQRLLEAFGELKRNQQIPHHLLIVGEFMWKGLHFEIHEEYKSFVHFTGHLSLQKLAKAVGSADCLAFVSYFEGFGIPIVEAMRAGTPVLAGNKTSLPEVGGDAVLYCDPFSVDSIKNQLLSLLTTPSLAEELTKKGLDRAKLFTWDRTAEQLWESLKKMLS